MNIKKSILTGLISIAPFYPCKAQKAVQLVSETGITGVINKEASFYTGMNFEFLRGKNYTDLYAGVGLKPDKNVSFTGLVINNFAWAKNISSWFRGTFVASKKNADSIVEIAPVKANASVGKFNFSLSPSYTLYNDFKNGAGCTQGVNTIFQTTYTLSPDDMLFAEAKYTSIPSKSLLNTQFGKLKNNIAFMVSYMKRF